VTEPIAIVSADAHIGPRLVEDLRPLCPPDLLSAFDAYVADPNRSKGRYVEHDAVEEDPDDLTLWRNQFTSGHHDPEVRRREMDADGIAAEVVYHGSQNNEPVPFQTTMLGVPDDPGLYAAGIRIYNTWLADTCAAHPDRHVGLAHLPIWDVDASVEELRWAAAAGLRGVNFPAPRSWLLPYNDRAWEPFWTAAEELSMVLSTHSGAGDPAVFQGAELTALMSIESGGWFSRRAAHLLIFAGVFERHPELKLVLTEQPGEWWPAMAAELDSVHRANTSWGGPLKKQVPLAPSEYLHRNVWIGASFLSRSEAHGAVRDGYADRVMWGSDYPHMEATWQRGPTAYSPLSLRFALSGLDEATVRAMVGGTAARVYGLDEAALRATAERIGAPTFAELSEPLETVPAGASPFAFRTRGAWD
jgi:predicted TIM-barrel fold metal-dependent hydrolase